MRVKMIIIPPFIITPLVSSKLPQCPNATRSLAAIPMEAVMCYL